MGRHIAIIATDDLYADSELVQIVDRASCIRFGRVQKDKKAAKGHALFVITAKMYFRGDFPCGHGQNPKAFGPLRFEDLLQFCAPLCIQRNLHTVAILR